MAMKRLRPVTPSMRFAVLSDRSEVTKDKPEKSLVVSLKKSGGRNNLGRVTSRRRGGGHKRRYRIVDFKRDKYDVAGNVVAIEYDPNRTSRIALVEYPDQEKRYIIWPKGLEVGEQITSTSDSMAEIKPGNTMKLDYIPLGTLVHNVELNKGKGGVFVRSAGSWAQVQAKDKGLVQLRMPSGEVRLVSAECRATVGQVGNVEHKTRSVGKAGRNRWYGRRPKVRGVAMNPIDHPHGGGEGKAGQGNPHPVTPWGKPTKGGKTRRPKPTDRFIVKNRKSGR